MSVCWEELFRASCVLVFKSVSVLCGLETERYELQAIWSVETSGVNGETSAGGSPDP